MKEQKAEMVVLVHGLWMNGREMVILAKRLQHHGFRTRRFSYHTMTDDLEQSAVQLFEFVEQLAESRIHFVCHSMGGLLLNRVFSRYKPDWQGRAVLLGSPLAGSRVAQSVNSSIIGQLLVGRNLPNLCAGCSSWPVGYEIGVIGGTLNVGLGLLVGGWKHPGDGLVTLDEIKVPGVKETLYIRATHLGLVFSSLCASKVSFFLKKGCFG